MNFIIEVLQHPYTYRALLALLLVVPCFLIWSAVHEYSHWVAAKLLLGARNPKFKLYPHKYKDTFRWASVRYTVTTDRFLPAGRALISLAPRLPGLIACTLMPVGLLLSGYLQIVWFMLFGSGVVDYMMGLIGKSPHSDLQKASAFLGMNPWRLRIYSSWPLLIPAAVFVTLILSI
jgi:hypothetical protein